MARKAKSEAKQPSPPFQLVEADSPDGPWTPVPPEAIVRQGWISREEVLRETPDAEWFLRVDHRTELGPVGKTPEMLGFSGLDLIRKRFGENARLVDLEAWLLDKRGLHIKDMSWSTFLALVARVDGEAADRGSPFRRQVKPRTDASLTDEELEVLYVLEERDTLTTARTVRQSLKDKGIPRSEGTVKTCVRRLCDCGFAERPRKRKGARITPEGKAYLSHT